MATQTDQPLVLSEVWPRAFSAGLVVAGATAAIATVVGLGRGVWPLNVTSPFFAIIIAGAVAVGLVFVLGGLQPRAKRWEIHEDRIVVDLQLLIGFRRQLTILPGMIADLAVDEQDWDSRPKTWCLRVTLADGRRLSTPEIATQAAAEAARDLFSTFSAVR